MYFCDIIPERALKAVVLKRRNYKEINPCRHQIADIGFLCGDIAACILNNEFAARALDVFLNAVRLGCSPG